MLKNLLKKFDGVIGGSVEVTPEEKFFSNIVGYPDMKKLLLTFMVSRNP